MASTYDIFRKPSGQNLIWVTSVEGLEDAKQQAAHLAMGCPDDFYVYNLMSGSIVARVENKQEQVDQLF
jgi:hypothetical protein